MILSVQTDEQSIPVAVADELLAEAEDYFEQLDRDMDRGWQMSRHWVENPSLEQRCQIVADRLLSALHNRNQQLAVLMAAYILNRLPGVRTAFVDITGDMSLTEFEPAVGPSSARHRAEDNQICGWAEPSAAQPRG